MEFGIRLKTFRKNLGLTQKELAKEIGVKRTTVAGYETEGKMPPYNTLIKIADTLNCSLDLLLGYVMEDGTEYKVEQINPKIKKSYDKLAEREDLQILLKETEDLNPDSIKRIVKIIKLIKEEENTRN